jgi:hypothetical protein
MLLRNCSMAGFKAKPCTCICTVRRISHNDQVVGLGYGFFRCLGCLALFAALFALFAAESNKLGFSDCSCGRMAGGQLVDRSYGCNCAGNQWRGVSC